MSLKLSILLLYHRVQIVLGLLLLLFTLTLCVPPLTTCIAPRPANPGVLSTSHTWLSLYHTPLQDASGSSLVAVNVLPPNPYFSTYISPTHHRYAPSPLLVSSSRPILSAWLSHSMTDHSDALQGSTRWHSEHACFCFALVDSAPYSRTLVPNLRLPTIPCFCCRSVLTL